MRKAIITMVVLVASVANAQQATLMVDFGTGSSPVASGYEAYTATNEQESTFTSQSFEAFETIISITPTWAENAVAAVRQMFDRGANQNDYGLVDGVNDPEEKDDLMRDWIGSDTRSTGDPLTLTISGLPAGLYDWISYHNDTGTTAPVGIFDVTVNDALGSVTTTDIQGTSASDDVVSIDEVATFTTQIVSDGINDVTIIFDNQPYTSEWNWAWL